MEHVQEALDELNEVLGEQGAVLDAIAVGGYIMERHGLRATHDIDAFFEADARIREAIWAIGERHGINHEGEPWLNSSVANVNPWPKDVECEVIYHKENLRVLGTPLEYVAGMKCECGREGDRDDIGLIMGHLKIDTVADAKRAIAGAGFQNVDESLLLAGMATGRDSDWLVRESLAMMGAGDDGAGGPGRDDDDGWGGWY